MKEVKMEKSKNRKKITFKAKTKKEKIREGNRKKRELKEKTKKERKKAGTNVSRNKKKIHKVHPNKWRKTIRNKK